MALTGDKILAHSGKFPTREVHVPAWRDSSGDDVVIVRGLSSAEWDAHQAALAQLDANGKKAVMPQARLVVKCAQDEQGAPLFTPAQVTRVADLGAGQVTDLVTAIVELSGLVTTDEGAAPDPELEGNSDAAPSGDSSSD